MSGLWRRNCLYKVQVTGLALHALEPDEELDVLDHLPRCPSCRAALADAERALAVLGVAVEQVEPPAALRGTILSEAAETVQGPASRPAAEAADVADVADRIVRPRRPIDGRVPPPVARPGLSRRARLVAACLVLVGLVSIGGLAVRSVQLAEQRDAQTAQAQTLAEIVTGLDAPGTRHATLTRPDGTVLAAVVVHDGRRTLVTSADLAPNSADRDIYVVWGIGAGGPQPIDTFDVRAPGSEVFQVGPDAAGNHFAAYAISIEPGRTAPAEPSTVVASGFLEA